VKLSIIIPVYNEEQTISEVVERVRAVDIGAIEKEIIIANDGSSDGTRLSIDSSRWVSDPRIKTYDNPINVGKGGAVRIGLKYATGDLILIQDADLELDPEEYGGLIAPILEGRTDVVYGSRFLKPTGRISLRTRVANKGLTWFTNVLFGGRLTDMETAYKVFRREVLDGIRLRCVGFDFEPELTAKLLLSGRSILEVPVRYNPRRADEGKKIRWTDGVDAVYALLKCRFGRRPARAPARRAPNHVGR
jgi:glycosyltransferase involved in cell wall biosynthesis